tara:strand:- start:5503 stop:6663 length:1161 start_codon:yes stop_codon:yes gene_type:complete
MTPRQQRLNRRIQNKARRLENRELAIDPRKLAQVDPARQAEVVNQELLRKIARVALGQTDKGKLELVKGITKRLTGAGLGYTGYELARYLHDMGVAESTPGTEQEKQRAVSRVEPPFMPLVSGVKKLFNPSPDIEVVPSARGVYRAVTQSEEEAKAADEAKAAKAEEERLRRIFDTTPGIEDMDPRKRERLFADFVKDYPAQSQQQPAQSQQQNESVDSNMRRAIASYLMTNTDDDGLTDEEREARDRTIESLGGVTGYRPMSPLGIPEITVDDIRQFVDEVDQQRRGLSYPGAIGNIGRALFSSDENAPKLGDAIDALLNKAAQDDSAGIGGGLGKSTQKLEADTIRDIAGYTKPSNVISGPRMTEKTPKLRRRVNTKSFHNRGR